MYINEFDNFIDKILDDFYDKIQNKKINKNDIWKLLNDYINSINTNELKTYIHDDNAIYFVIEFLKKYIFIYLILYNWYLFETNFEDDIVKMMSNDNSIFKIDNFYNPENCSKIIKLYKLLESIMDVLDKKKNKDGEDFLNMFNKEFINKTFKSHKKNDNVSNIIKTIILIRLYKKDRIEILNVLEKKEYENNEFTFIDIVVPKDIHFDLQTIEEVLDKHEVKKGYAYDIWDLLKDLIKVKNKDEKINELFNSNLLVPIVDDFMTYHNEAESYEKQEKMKKDKIHSDTRIRYVLNKINTMSDFYTHTNQEELKKVIYIPQKNKRAISVNDYENIKIVNKYRNIGKDKTDEQYNELIGYMKYPYINFKDTKKNGFNIMITKTLNLIRGVSFEEKNNDIQWRVGNKEHSINVIGLLVTNNKHFRCIKIKNAKAVQNYDTFVSSILSTYDSKDILSKYWLFDFENENIKIPTYEYESNQITSEYAKNVMGNIYDAIMTFLNRQIELYIKENNKKSTIRETLEQLDKLSLVTNIKINYDYFERIIYELSKIDYNLFKPHFYHVLYGIQGTIIKLPTYSIPIDKIKVLKINLNKTNFETKMVSKNIDARCQHIIYWDYIISLKKKDPVKYSNLLFEFIKRYVEENSNYEFICKSCGGLINLRKFVYDGVLDGTSGEIIPINIPLDTPLEEIFEYEKYKLTILNIDKIIERIAKILDLGYYYSGIPETAKYRRKTVVKNTIDTIIENNKILKEKFKDRNVDKKYNINSKLTNLFVFDLDDTIFMSSKNKDEHYRNIKINNILIYSILVFLLDQTKNNLINVSGDRKGLCNYFIYEKYGKALFTDIKVIINKSYDTNAILNYKILSYILYIVSCLIVKYNMWYGADKTSTKKFNIYTQKIIINTLVDTLNSLLETQKGSVFEVISLKYFTKLNTVYMDEQLIDIFKNKYKYQEKKKKKTYHEDKISPIKLTGLYEETKYDVRIKTDLIKKKNVVLKVKDKHNYKINSYTNCKDGKFHNWILRDNDIVCSNCGIKYNSIKVSDKDTKEIIKEIKDNNLKEIINKYCDKYTCQSTNVNKVINNIEAEKKEIIKEANDKINILISEHDKEVNDRNKMINNLNKKFNKNFINSFIETIQNNIGTNLKILNIDVKDLHFSSYIVNYDYQNNKLKDKLILNDKDITIKYNHPYYKTDVLYYVKNKKEIYYDLNTFMLIGYKDAEYIDVNYTHKIDVNWSLIYEITKLGIINDLRDNNLSYFIYTLIKILNNIIYEKKSDKQEENYDKFDKITEKYRDKLKNIKLDNIFSNWKLLFDVIDTSKWSNDIKLFYIVNELNEIINMNTIKVLKENICYFLIEYINMMFYYFNDEKYKDNKYIKTFSYLIESEMFTLEQSYENITTGIYDEYIDPDYVKTKEELREAYDAKEEQDALDIDMSMTEGEEDTPIDYEDMYDKAYTDMEINQ